MRQMTTIVNPPAQIGHVRFLSRAANVAVSQAWTLHGCGPVVAVKRAESVILMLLLPCPRAKGISHC
jgi:hypothetical protein